MMCEMERFLAGRFFRLRYGPFVCARAVNNDAELLLQLRAGRCVVAGAITRSFLGDGGRGDTLHISN